MKKVICAVIFNSNGQLLITRRSKGKYKDKSCVSWKIEGEPTDSNKIIWEGEAVVIDETAKNEDE